eukprot:gene5653-6523_t
MTKTGKDITVLGAGLAGCALAVLLAKSGHNVEVFEKRPRETNVSPQTRARSINLALSERGIKTLQEAGVMEDILPIAIPMKGRMIHAVDGKTNFQPYSSDSEKHLYSVSRALLNERLRNHAEANNVTFHYDQGVQSVDLRAGSFTTQDGVKHQADTMIGADGAFSALRAAMVRTDRADYSQSYLAHGYKELCIPSGPDNGFLLDKNCLHIWPRSSYMMIALPNIDGSFTCTLFFPFEGATSFASLDSREAVDAFFSSQFADAKAMMPTLVDDFMENPTCSLVTVRANPWSIGNKAVLIGDAAHAIVPFYGQGMNAAFEDVLELYNQMNKLPNDLATAYTQYTVARRANSDAIGEMAVENFIEMRDSVSDDTFVFKKKVEHLLQEKFPQRYISRYELISFTRTPYAEAQRLGLINQQLLNILIKDANFDLQKIDLVQADTLIKDLLQK